LAGVASPANTDGISYLPTLLGDAIGQRQHDNLYWEFYEQGGKQAVRQGKWKAVRLNALAPEQAFVELYNLDHDVGEKDDVAAAHPDVVARLTTLMREAHVDQDGYVIKP
jgi:arylsulfatase A-like enzyme